MKLFKHTIKTGFGYAFRISLPGHKFTCLETFEAEEDAAFAADVFKLVLVRKYGLTGNTMWRSLSPVVFSRLLGEVGIDEAKIDDLYFALPASCKDYLLDGGNQMLLEFSKAQEAKKASGHPNRKRIGRLKLKYGITLEDFTRIHNEQGGACAICKRINIKLCVDHDHVTEKVRSLLCNQCNTALGLLRDSSQLATAAVNYLITHGK